MASPIPSREQRNRMISAETNPFHELFVTDSAAAEEFVRYFSPFLVPHLPELFREGNVVLKGTQGCGKSMLLKLFQPEIRVAYAERSVDRKLNGRLEFPVPEELRAFIGAGVNLSKSGLLDIAQMLPADPTEAYIQDLTALFIDFLNYWLLRDLLQSLEYISKRHDVFDDLVNSSRFDAFVSILRQQDCWFGYLSEVDNFDQLKKTVSRRVINYRSWTARNTALDSIISETKTAIGQPLSATVDCLKEARVIGRDVKVFLRVDQMEELWHREGPQADLAQHFREVINRVIGNRDLRVSFRIGTRRYAWSGHLSMPGGRQIEELRDYVVVDLDKRLRRREDRATWLFEGFAADVFWHRVVSEPQLTPDEKQSELRNLQMFFGRSPTPHQLVECLIVTPPDDPQKLLKLDDHWSREWRDFIARVYNKQLERKTPKGSRDYSKAPLDALLTAAWGLQTGGVKGGQARRSRPPPRKFPPWTQWWEKERLMVGVMQLVARHRQNLLWWGHAKVLMLSASNITLFLSICREVWDQWRRRSFPEDALSGLQRSEDFDSIVPWRAQAVAIDNVSKRWHRNFARQPGRPAGDLRMRFVDEIAHWLRRGLIEDIPMSNPGANGFSLRQSDLHRFPQLVRLLEEAVGWGDFYEVEHTTKISTEKHRDPRRKYYLNPILSPHFQLPEAHTKEPVYAAVETIIGLAVKAEALTTEEIQLRFHDEDIK